MLTISASSRTFDNAPLNLGLKNRYHDGIEHLEDLIDKERDAPLGNGGLGRLAACYLDSSSQDLPVWGYALRYKYGIFQQLITPDGSQLEAPRSMVGAPQPILDPTLRYPVRD